MKECLYYEKIDYFTIRCMLCPHQCEIPESKTGKCRIRQNIDGKLTSLVYGKATSIHVDPIEKKPLYHFRPGSTILSLGTVGCNLKCKHCQNWRISMGDPSDVTLYDASAQQVISIAQRKGVDQIAYTYNEPFIAYEYLLDLCTEAHTFGMKNIVVTNGFINEEPLRRIIPHIDAANVDLKGFTDAFYSQVCSGTLDPVLRTLQVLKESDVWLEVTNLIIPTLNDDLEVIRNMCKWIYAYLGPDVPIHFSAFHPDYKLVDIHHISASRLVAAKHVAEEEGLHFAYIGNISAEEGNNSYCPHCKTVIIKRERYTILNNLKGTCTCGQQIPGVWH